PIGIPHATTRNDIYSFQKIPRFSPSFRILMLHYRDISQDERLYPDASRFIPERFLDANEALTNDNPAEYTGRRVCPGWLGYPTLAGTLVIPLWSAIATMLATVEFSFAKDDQGEMINFTPQFTTELTRCFVSLCHSILLSLTVLSFLLRYGLSL
ncbi:cytochrome P450, partial [Suillus bovinus]|uniref:cytochrome P450 n=1 Tax=Suillus bovinus TaxID=48563 RepID=UPI001B866FA0